MGFFSKKNENDEYDIEDIEEASTSSRAALRCKIPPLCDTRPKKISWGVCAAIVILLSIILIATSIKRLSSTEFGLQYDVIVKQLDDGAEQGGLHLGPPGFRFVKFPSTFITVDLPEDICVSRDGLRVSFAVTFQYQLPRPWVMPVVTRYRDFERWNRVVRAAGQSAVQHSCSEFTISDFQNKRGVIQTTMEDNLRLKLDGPDGDGAGGTYARAISLQLRNVELPQQYQTAVAERQAAAEDITLAQNQRTQETTKAQTQLLAANEEARKILDTARNEANVTITEARLQAEETTFAFATETEVIVSVKNSLNLTSEGILSYMANQLYSTVPQLKVSAGEPSRLSRKDEL